MSLFKKLHNEALDEDLKAQRQVIENLRKQVKLFSGVTLVKPEIGDNEKYTLDKYINSFIESLNNFAGAQREGETRAVEFSASTLMSKYNALALYLENIDLKSLADADKVPIVQKLDDLLPLIKNVQRITSRLESVFDKQIINDISMNFENQLYKPIGVKPGQVAIKDKQEKLLLDIIEVIQNGEATLASGKDLLTYELESPKEEATLAGYVKTLTSYLDGLRNSRDNRSFGPGTKGLINKAKKLIGQIEAITNTYSLQ